jgi:hypothetical protein
LTTCAKEDSPCRKAYIDRQGSGKDRESWDLLSIMIAVRGAESVLLDEIDHGYTMTVNENGKETWTEGTDSN